MDAAGTHCFVIATSNGIVWYCICAGRQYETESVPRLGSLHAWANHMQDETVPSGKLGEALGYLLTQWPKLIRYVEDR
jgi:Transposase IS66 family